MAFAHSHTLAPTSGTISPMTSGTLLLSLPSKANPRHFSSQNIFTAKQHCPSPLSVSTMCVCMRACMCVCVSECTSFAVTLEHYTLCISFFPLFLNLYIADNILHPDVHSVCYIMLVQCSELQSRRFTNFHYYYYLSPNDSMILSPNDIKKKLISLLPSCCLPIHK